MERDVMVIRQKDPSKPDLVLHSDNTLSDLGACKLHPKYKALKKPRSTCKFCWAYWAQVGIAITSN